MALKQATLIHGPRVALVLNERELAAVTEEMGITGHNSAAAWADMGNSSGLTWHMDVDGVPSWIVGLNADLDLKDVVSTLVHESVHVWQGFKDYIQERAPSIEFEAYSIQGIHDELMLQFSQSRAGRKRIKQG